MQNEVNSAQAITNVTILPHKIYRNTQASDGRENKANLPGFGPEIPSTKLQIPREGGFAGNLAGLLKFRCGRGIVMGNGRSRGR